MTKHLEDIPYRAKQLKSTAKQLENNSQTRRQGLATFHHIQGQTTHVGMTHIRTLVIIVTGTQHAYRDTPKDSIAYGDIKGSIAYKGSYMGLVGKSIYLDIKYESAHSSSTPSPLAID